VIYLSVEIPEMVTCSSQSVRSSKLSLSHVSVSARPPLGGGGIRGTYLADLRTGLDLEAR
jgi:hypothetical protein